MLRAKREGRGFLKPRSVRSCFIVGVSEFRQDMSSFITETVSDDLVDKSRPETHERFVGGHIPHQPLLLGKILFGQFRVHLILESHQENSTLLVLDV